MVTTETESTSMHNAKRPLQLPITKAGITATFAILTALVFHPSVSAQSVQPNGSQQNPQGQLESRPQTAPNTPGSLISVPEDFAGLKLAPGFLLNVLVYDEPDFSGPARVDSEGNVNIA